MVGAHGENGAHALRRVALEHSTAVGPARIQGLRMEGDSALEKTRRPGTVTQILAQVRMLFNQKTLTVRSCSHHTGKLLRRHEKLSDLA